MNEIILWTPTSRSQRERRVETWRRYTALQALLHSQLQRIGELDAVLGILIALESVFFIQFFDRTFAAGYVYNVVITCLLAIPLFLSIWAMLALRAAESPDAEWFNKGLDENENVTLMTAARATVEDFVSNLSIVEGKESTLLFSMVSFLTLSIAYILGGMLE